MSLPGEKITQWSTTPLLHVKRFPLLSLPPSTFQLCDKLKCDTTKQQTCNATFFMQFLTRPEGVMCSFNDLLNKQLEKLPAHGCERCRVRGKSDMGLNLHRARSLSTGHMFAILTLGIILPRTFPNRPKCTALKRAQMAHRLGSDQN